MSALTAHTCSFPYSSEVGKLPRGFPANVRHWKGGTFYGGWQELFPTAFRTHPCLLPLCVLPLSSKSALSYFFVPFKPHLPQPNISQLPCGPSGSFGITQDSLSTLLRLICLQFPCIALSQVPDHGAYHKCSFQISRGVPVRHQHLPESLGFQSC